MKYADGPETEVEVRIAAPPGRVWRLVTDIEVPPRFSPELRRVEGLDGATAAAVGARFSGFNGNAELPDWRTVCHITECYAPTVFGYAVVDADRVYGDPEPPSPERPMARWRFTLTPDGDGTLLRQHVRLGPARSGVSLAIDAMPDREDALVAYRLKDLARGMRATLDGIKQLAEQV